MPAATATLEKNNRKICNAWCMYDWANSVFPLTITSAIFPIYWKSQTKEGVSLLGMRFLSDELFSYCISFAFLIIALVSPILSGIADSAGNKKSFMRFFVFLGAFACIGMSFFDREHAWIGVMTLVLGSIGYAGSIVFYNAYLPEIATEDHYDRLSAKGFSLGYIGGVILLIINLAFILKPDLLWADELRAKNLELRERFEDLNPEAIAKMANDFFAAKASRLAFVTVGIWWIGFSLIPFYFLPKRRNTGNGISLSRGYKELTKVFAQVKQAVLTQKFLMAFFFAAMGVQTVMYVATIFAGSELKMPADKLIITVLIIQLIAVPGAYVFSTMSRKIGNFNTLLIGLAIWIGVCAGAYMVTTPMEFYILATIVGFIMGGSQSLFRSTYAKLIPLGSPDTASYFSFYEFTEKIAIVIGTFSFGYIQNLVHKVTGQESLRYSVLALMVFFIVGSLLMFRIRKEKIED